MVVDNAWFAYGLILILWEIELTQEVLGAVVIHLDQVIATIVLSVVVLYWFTLIAYHSSWRNAYNFNGQMNCDTLIDCVRIHID